MVWIAMPAQVEAYVVAWARTYPAIVSLATLPQFDGHTVYAVTVTDRSTADGTKPALLCVVPHAHEPAGTAACMGVLCQLITGRTLEGEPSAHDVVAFRRQVVVTIIPDANPGGRARSPVDAWDGLQYTNDEFLAHAFGIDAQSGERFPRPNRWRVGELEASILGIVWERVNADTYVEPNRDPGSSLFRLTRHLSAERTYSRWLDLHQTEFEGTKRNCQVLLPVTQDELPQPIRDENQAWGHEISRAWEALGARPAPPQALNYTGQQRDYFVSLWGEHYRHTPEVSTEVQNNNTSTPPQMQRDLQEAAIWVSIEGLLRNPR